MVVLHSINRNQILAINTMEGSKNNTMVLAGSIILAGLLIAVGVFVANRDLPEDTVKEDGGDTSTVALLLPAVTEKDHIIGSIDASIVLVEYSDTECPFCKNFHDVLNEIMVDYKDGNELAWVYRHFPLASLHPKAATEAHATECAYELGGESAFWAYINRLYEVTPSNNGLDLNELPKIAEYVGLDVDAFNQCQKDGKYKTAIQESYQGAIKAGGNGTPFNIFVLKEKMNDSVMKAMKDLQSQFRPGSLLISDDGKRVAISGGLPKEGVVSFVDIFLGKNPVADESTPTE